MSRELRKGAGGRLKLTLSRTKKNTRTANGVGGLKNAKKEKNRCKESGTRSRKPKRRGISTDDGLVKRLGWGAKKGYKKKKTTTWFRGRRRGG